MTIKEINELRKSGRLQESLAAAENEFSQNQNHYTCGALFWCLYDLLKQQTGDEATNTVDRMKTLYNDFGAGDEYMQRALTTIQRISLPHYYEVKNALENAKSGSNIITTYKLIKKWYDDGELNQQLYQDFGWLTYYALKQTDLGAANFRKILLHQYLKLNLSRPSILHSRILGEAIKVEQSTPLLFRIRDFIKIWGLENLRSDDWEQFKTDDDKTIPSVVEKLITVYTKELKTDNVPAPTEFHDLVNRALVKYPSNQYMPFYKASVLKSQGEYDEALNYYKQLILKSPTKCYLWNQASALVTDVDLKIALLCKAISVEHDESFVGGCRLNIAKALIEKGLFSNAQDELKKYNDFYSSQGWSLKPEYHTIISQIPQDIILIDNTQLYNEYIPKAEEFIYSALPSVFAIKLEDRQLDDRYHPGQKFIQWTLRTKDGIFKLKKPSKFGINGRTKNGTPFDIKIQNERIVWIKMSGQNPLQQDWIKKCEGVIKIRTDKNKKH